MKILEKNLVLKGIWKKEQGIVSQFEISVYDGNQFMINSIDLDCLEKNIKQF